MKRSSGLLLLALPLFAGTATAAETQSSVPSRFQGEWRSDLKLCGTEEYDDSRMTIGAGRIGFLESGGPIKAIVTQRESDLALIAELSGEGETWLAYKHFRLSADGKSLTDVTDATGEQEFVRYRCPPRAK